MHGSEHMWCFRWFRSDAVVFWLFKLFSLSLQHIWRTYRANIRDQLIENTAIVSVDIIRIKRCFPRTNLIGSPCACDLFVSKVTKITRYMDVRFWRSFFSAFSVCDDCILKSTKAWLLKLSVLYIHSFMQVHNTTFQIKTVFNNVLFSTEVHNPLHAHLLALSQISWPVCFSDFA